MQRFKDFLILIILVLFAFCLSVSAIILCEKAEKEQALVRAAKLKESASLYEMVAKQKEVSAMVDRQEAEKYRKAYYQRIFKWGAGLEGWTE